MSAASHYQFNVSLNGLCYFNTDPEWGQFLTSEAAVAIYDDFVKRFPPDEGFKVTLHYWACSGKTLIED